MDPVLDSRIRVRNYVHGLYIGYFKDVFQSNRGRLTVLNIVVNNLFKEGILKLKLSE